MTTDRETETTHEQKPTPRATAPAPGAEARDNDGVARAESSDARETFERGYGWGV